MTAHRIGNVNLYVGNPAPAQGIRRLLAASPWQPVDSIGVQEASNAIGKLRTLLLYRTHVKRGRDRFERSNAIMVRRRYQSLGFEWIFAVAGTGTAYTPPRNIVVARYRKHGTSVAHVSTHLHVIPEDELRGTDETEWSPAVRQYVAHVQRLLAIVERLRNERYTVFVTADGNARPRHDEPDWQWSLYDALERKAGMRVWRNGVDVVAWFPRQVIEVGTRTFSPSLVGSDDHEPMIVRLDDRA